MPLSGTRERFSDGLTLGRIASILEREGTRGILGRSLARLGWRSYGLWLRDLDEALPHVPAGLPVDIGELRVRDAEGYAAFRPGTAPQAVDRLRSGHAGFVAWRAGRVVAATWVAV